MDKENILRVCRELSRAGGDEVNIFDIMYETSLSYDQLKGLLDELTEEHKLQKKDKKTYIFTSDIPNLPAEDDGLEERYAALEERRKRLMEKSSQKDDTQKLSAAEAVNCRIKEIIDFDLTITRTQAILIANGCLFESNRRADKSEAAIYEQVVCELNSMSNYLFNRIKKGV